MAAPSDSHILAHLEKLENIEKYNAQVKASSDNAYRWDRLDRRTQHFQPQLLSGDAELYGADLMQGRVRNEALNNGQIKNAIDKLVDLIIGTGIQTFADPIDPGTDLESDLEDEFNYALESDGWFEDWANDPTQCDAEGKRTWFEMQRLGLRECVQAGNFILLRCQRNEPGRIVPLCYQLIEKEQLDTTMDRPRAPGQNKIVNGIELDRFGRAIAFHIYDSHPYDHFSAFSTSDKSTRIPASRVTHLYAFHRPSMSIGVNWLHALGQNSFDRDKLISSELATAAKVALMALVHKATDGAAGGVGLNDEDGELSDEYGNEEMVLGTSPVAAQIGADEDLQIVESTRPNPDIAPFVDVLDHDGAGAIGLSHVRYTGRYEKTSYSSARAAHLDDEAHFRPIRNWLGRGVAIPVRREFNGQAAVSGIFNSITPAEFRRSERKYQRFEAIGPGREQLDPEKETEASLAKIRGGLSSHPYEIAKAGRHWMKVLREQAIAQAVMAKLGLSVDVSKGNGGQGEQQPNREEANAEG